MPAMREAPIAAKQAARSPDALYQKLSPGPGKLASDVADHQSVRIQKAMVELVAEQGYDAVKVRDIVRLAGVSTRAFYELFDGKEDCLLRTHEQLMRGAARGVIVSQAGEHGWRERLSLLFGAFADALVSQPAAVCLAAVDAYAAGPAALEQARRAQSTLEAMIGETFARAPDGTAMPPLLIEGMVAGAMRVVRARFLSGREAELPTLVDELMEWTLCYPGNDVAGLAELDGRFESVKSAAKASLPPSGLVDDDRAIILAAVTKLAAAEGYGELTIPRIRAGAGVSRRKFNTHFEGVEDCFLAALEQRAGDAIDQAGRAQIAGRSWPGGIYRAISTLCDRVADDPILASVCLADDFPPGSSGSRSRKRLIAAVADQLVGIIPYEHRPSDLAVEASTAAIWELFHHHVVRALPQQQRPQIAATLSYIALAPVVGSSAAMAAISREQVA